MPNWCYTDAVFYGDEENVAKFANELERLENIQRPNEQPWLLTSDSRWLGYLAGETLGKDVDSDYPCRGTITSWEPGEDSITFQYESAWSPCYKLMVDLAKHYDLKFAFWAEETGLGLYEKFDPDGRLSDICSKWVVWFNQNSEAEVEYREYFSILEMACDPRLAELGIKADMSDDEVSEILNAYDTHTNPITEKWEQICYMPIKTYKTIEELLES